MLSGVGRVRGTPSPESASQESPLLHVQSLRQHDGCGGWGGGCLAAKKDTVEPAQVLATWGSAQRVHRVGVQEHHVDV